MRRRFVWKTWVCDAHGAFSGLSEDGQPLRCSDCGQLGHRPDPIGPTSPTVYGDTLWGGPRWVENLDTQPVWIETKSQYRAECAARGFENRVHHVPVPGTDKSPVTVTWDIGSAPGHDPRPMAALSPAEQKVRREEASVRLGLTVSELEAISGNR
jgi:hypothetical protein